MAEKTIVIDVKGNPVTVGVSYEYNYKSAYLTGAPEDCYEEEDEFICDVLWFDTDDIITQSDVEEYIAENEFLVKGLCLA